MQFQDIIQMSLGYTFRQKRRTFSVLIGVALCVTLILVVIISGATITNTISQQILNQGSLRQITVTAPNQNATIAPNVGGASQLDDTRITSWRAMPHVVAAYPDLQLTLTATSGNVGIIFTLMNQPDQKVQPALLRGTWPQDSQIVIPNVGIRNKLDQNVDGLSLLEKTIMLRVPTEQGSTTIKQIPVTVSGVYNATQNVLGQATAYTSLPFMKSIVTASLGNEPLTYPVATVMVDQPQKVQGVADLINKQGFFTSDIEAQVAGLNKRLQGITVIGIALALFIFVLVSLSIGNLLMSSVRQRRKEIGIMFATGFKVSSVGQIITGEAICIGLIGALAGIAATIAGVLVFALVQPGISLYIPWWGIPFVTLTAILLCAVASIFPARRAMQMDVIQALREE